MQSNDDNDKNLRETAKKELEELAKVRSEFYKYLDTHLPKTEDRFDFSTNPQLDAKDIYTLFYKLDYQARKLRPYIAKAYNLKLE